MAIYVYRCRSCGDFEHRQAMSSPALTRCPNCDLKVERVPQPFNSMWKKGQNPNPGHLVDTSKFDEAFEKKVIRE